MANPKHEEILNHGVAAWNTWRKENPLVRPDLSGHLLQHQFRFDIRYGTRDLMDWMSGTEEARKCSQALKDDSIYYDPYWEDCWRIQLLRGINFENADLTDAKLILADLSEADLKNADLEGANLQRTVC